MTALALAVALLALPVQAARIDDGSLGSRLRGEFPLVAHALSPHGANAEAPDEGTRPTPRQSPRQFSDGMVLEGAGNRVLLKPVTTLNTPAHQSGAEVEYRGAFRGVDVLRTGAAEILFVESASAASRIAYESSGGLAMPSGRGVRFVSTRGEDLRLSAPVVVDAAGRPSFSARWSVDRTSRGDILRLGIADRSLRYPVAVLYSRGATAPALRSLRVAANATGSISGTVTDQVSSATIENAAVLVYDSAGEFVDFTLTDASGNYSIGGLGTDSYRALFIADAFDPELYDGIPCADFLCSPLDGTPIAVTDGANTDVDASLTSGAARVSGHVRDSGANPLPRVTVVLYDASGVPAGSDETDESGEYTVVVPAGTYYARTFNNAHAGLTDQLYSGTVCTACDPTTGTAIAVSNGALQSGIDFTLTSGGRIAGVVSDEVSAAGLEAQLAIFSAAGDPVSFAETDASGAYTSFHGLAPGSYRVVAKSAGHATELYDDMPCGEFCDPTAGDAVTVNGTSTTGNIDFALTSLESVVSGTVRDSSGNPMDSVEVTFYDTSGVHALLVTSDITGRYTARLPGSGTYFARAHAATLSGYIDELYSGIDCSGCPVTSGTPIDVTAGVPVENVDFSLANDGGTITGRILDASTAAAVGFGWVQVYSATGEFTTYGYSDAGGNYTLLNSLTAGTFYISGQAIDHVAELYDGIDCRFGCDPLDGTPVTVTRGAATANIDFSLATPGCSISLDPPSLPNGLVGDTWNQALTSNGVAPLSFAITAGALPDGLTLSSSGVLSGTLAVPGTFAFTIVVTDANGCEGGNNYTVQVSAGSTATTTTLTASPSSPVYGDTITLTATLTPSTADGTVSFFNGVDPEPFATATLVNGVGSTSIVLPVGVHNLTATYSGSEDYLASSDDLTVTVGKATPVVTWLTPLPITYGSALSSMELSATANVPGTFVYSHALGDILNAGSYTLSVVFTPDDGGNYNQASASVTLVVNKADQQIVWSNPSPIVYGTPLDSTQLNAVVFVGGPDPAGALTYDPPAGTVLNAGTATLTVDAAETANYNPATASVSVVVGPATGAFSNLSAPTIVVGTPSTPIGGRISSGSLIPPGNVTITIGSTSVTAGIQADGTFSASFPTGSLMPVSPGHTITFTYPGSANFDAATGTSLLIVVYGTTGGPLQNGAAKSGSVVPTRVSIRDAGGNNLSSPSLAVNAIGVRLTSSATWIPVTSTGNTTTAFEFQNAQGGSYFYNLDTDGLASGPYVLGFTVGSDPTIHTVSFTIK